MVREILLTGGSGLLGTELQKYIDVDAPSHNEFDILGTKRRGKYGLIIHAAAYTNVAKAEVDMGECYRTNVVGTANLISLYPVTPMVYISTEYAQNPTNYYGVTKKTAEGLVRRLPSYMIVRTLFKPNPFPWDKAFEDQYTQGDYVDVIAPLIARRIKGWDRENSSIVYVGTGRKTMLELARRTRQDVQPNSIKDIKSVILPADYE